MNFKKWRIALFAIAMVAPLSASAVGSAGDNNLVFSSALATPGAFNVVFNGGTPFGGLDNAVGVQEPGTALLMGLGLVGLAGIRRR